MTKLLVETTGDFGLMDFSVVGGFMVEHDRPTVVESTTFIQTNVSRGRIRVIAELPDTASDADFLDTLKNSRDVEMAIEAYKAELAPKPKPAPTKTAARK